MSSIPDPGTLVEIARSACRYVNDREWKKYQRYLNKFAQSGHSPVEKPLNFEEFCDTLGKNGDIPQNA